MESLMRDVDHETLSDVTVDCSGEGGAASSDLEYPVLWAEWTNEKHCSYLKSMEASFVNDLMSLRKCQDHKHGLMKDLSHQMKTHRYGGTWKNGSLFKDGNKSGVSRKSCSFMPNPRIRHFRQPDIYQLLEAQDTVANADRELESKLKPPFNRRINCNSKQLAATLDVLHSQNGAGNNGEMTGQNFGGNDQVIKSKARRAKSKKNEMPSDAENDQVVPNRDFTTQAEPRR